MAFGKVVSDFYWPDPKDCPYYCLRLFVCVCVCVCVSVVHPPSAQVLQSILIKLGHMDLVVRVAYWSRSAPQGGRGGNFKTLKNHKKNYFFENQKSYLAF